ncbi:photosystem II reaction center protein PsbX [Ralstonia pseudosolanacearum]|uniref:photosystem II reaction center protein PsbX n=1 Tax=Ralstonia pseudosolanacearum TaxID=1310165 RepID=UPI003CF6D23B
MASTSAVSMAMPITSSATHKGLPPSSSSAFFRPLAIKPFKVTATTSSSSKTLQVNASFKEKMVAGLSAGAVSALMVMPEVAEAAGSDLSPSLKNFLLSIAAGGVVLTAILGAVIGVSNFDPVKRT